MLVGNSLLLDVDVDKTSSGNPIQIRRNSGATLADIEKMIDDAAKTKTIDDIFIVCWYLRNDEWRSVANIKESIAQLLRRVKPLTPTITVSSVLPSKRRANPDRWADVNMKVKEAFNEVDVKFVDNDANFTSRNGAADDAAFQRDDLHLSESRVSRLLLNLSLPEQPPPHYKRPNINNNTDTRQTQRSTTDLRTQERQLTVNGQWSNVVLISRWASVPNAMRRTPSLPPADTPTKC